MHWSLGSRFTEDSITCTLHYVWWALFGWLQTVFITDLQVFRSLHACTGLWHWFTESMSRGSAKIHALYPHHCALHCTVKHTHCLAQDHCPKRLTESTLLWLGLLTVSCPGERSLIFSSLFVCFSIPALALTQTVTVTGRSSKKNKGHAHGVCGSYLGSSILYVGTAGISFKSKLNKQRVRATVRDMQAAVAGR